LLRGERQLVRVEAKERIVAAGGIHFMKEDALGVTAEPEGRRIGDHVHLVPPPPKLHSQLGRDSARSTIGRVAGDPDPHYVPRVSHKSAMRRANASGDSLASKVIT